MQRPLDPLGFKQNRYERPNQDWVCGHAADGHACPLGPDARGACRHTGECMPAKKGDRWSCMRSEAEGGKCTEGPLPEGACAHPIPPCQPMPSIRRSRGRLVWLFVALTSGALLILLGSSYLRQRWTDPGPLTSAHATSAAKCSDCHSVDRAAVSTLASFTAPEKSRLADSQLCLKCHALGDHPLTPHSVSPTQLIAFEQQLSTLPNESRNRSMLLRASHDVNPVRSDSGELACMTCHQEHHGRKFDLKKLSDAQCQSCHARQFASFEKGHPEFVNYPSRRRTPIFFDHASHLREHFAAMKAKAPTSCQDCHVKDGAGRFMKVKSFAQSCAACHEPQIEGEGATTKGVAFFTVPGIDAESLAAKGISIGEWPKFADGKITPFTELLLRRQPAMRDALDQLHGVDLLDLSKSTPGQLAAAEKFAWGVKNLLFHLVVDGQSYLRTDLKGEIAPAGIEIPRSALLAAQRDWMPHLLEEVTNYENGVKPALPKSSTPPPTPTPAPNENPPTGDQSLLGGDDLTTAAMPTPKPAASGGGDLLGGGNDDLTAATPTPGPAGGNDDLTSGGDLLAGGAAESAPTATPAAAPAVVAKSAEDWAAIGGWFRPQDSFTLYYRPAGHADPFLVAWLDAAAKLASPPASPAADAVFRQIANPQSAGICMKCHTVDTRARVTQVNWLPTEALPKKKGFTMFSHAAHLSLFGNTACETCHALNPKAQYAKFFSGEAGTLAERDPSHFESNFIPLSKAACVQCHQPKVAGDSCLLCHSYHVGATTGEIAGRNKLHPLVSGK
ncbi:MAG: cytochrome c3 family protein [Chthoniobacterales bacterium]